WMLVEPQPAGGFSRFDILSDSGWLCIEPLRKNCVLVRCEEIDCTAKHEKALHCSGGLALVRPFRCRSGRIPLRDPPCPVRQVGEGVSPTLDAGANMAGSSSNVETSLSGLGHVSNDARNMMA